VPARLPAARRDRGARADGLTEVPDGPPLEGPFTHDLDATAIVVHTSGTTSAPKPVALTYGNWLWSALGSAAALGHPSDERWLCALPLTHVGGLSILLRSAIAATTVLLHRRWSTEAVLGASTTRRSSRSCRPRSRGCSTPGWRSRPRCAGRCSAARRSRRRCSTAPGPRGCRSRRPTG
jgi:acyl-CoA synthetase (AMP-forming)/AMP-acid ligase II